MATLAENPAQVTLVERGSEFLTFEITGNPTNAHPPEYRIVLRNQVGQVADSGWSSSNRVRLEVPAAAWPVRGTLQTRNVERTENPALALNGTVFSDLSIPGVDADGNIIGSSAPVLSLNAGTVTTVLKQGDTIVLSGKASDANGDSMRVSATTSSVEKSVLLSGTGEQDWTLTWDITADQLCAGTHGNYQNIAVTAMDTDDNRTTVVDANVYRIDNAGPQAPAPTVELGTLLKGEGGSYTIRFQPGKDRGAAGVAHWSYALDGNSRTGAGSALPPITVAGDGAHTLTASYKDALGNQGEEATFAFTLDSVAPIVTEQALYTFDETLAAGWVTSNRRPAPSAWFNAELKAVFTSSDGTLSYGVTNSATPPTSYAQRANGLTATVRLGEGIHWIHLRAVDAAGNETVSAFGPYQIDQQPIPVTLTGDGSHVAKSHTVGVAVALPSQGAGLANIQYLWSTESRYADNLTGWQDVAPTEQTLALAGESGTFYLYLRVTDQAGNRTVERAGPLHMDNTPPELTVAKDTTSTAREFVAKIQVRDDSVLTRQAYLPGSHTAADFAGAGLELADKFLTLRENGDYTFFAQDEAGNETVTTHTVTGLDLHAPTITAEGPEKVWNKTPFTVTVSFSDLEGALETVGIIDPQYYNLPAQQPNSTAAYKTLPTFDGLVSAEDGIDTRYFDQQPAANLLDAEGKLTVTIGSDTGTLHYQSDGELMLHFAAADTTGNVSYASFGPYRLDSTPPTLTLDTPGQILADLVPEGKAGQHHFSGYAITDNITNQFAALPNITPQAGEGSYEMVFSAAAMNNFLVAGTYPGAVQFKLTDAAGNTATTTVDCVVRDIQPPVYGDGQKNLVGDSFTNFIAVTANQDATYRFQPEDFLPTTGVNILVEQSLPLRQITLRTLPTNGTLSLNNVPITAGQLPKSIPFTQISTLRYHPVEGWYGVDSGMGFIAMDAVGNQTNDTSDPTKVIFTVNRVNQAPQILGVPSVAQTRDNETYSIPFTVKDVDTPSGNLTVTAQSDGVARCTVQRQSDGSWRLTVQPKHNETTHTETITLIANDHEAQNNTTQATLALTVTYAEKLVLARPDGRKTGADKTVIIDVLANDQLPDPLKRLVTGVEITQQPTSGDAQVITKLSRARAVGEPLWQIRYTASGDDASQDTLKYKILLSNVLPKDVQEARVTITDNTPPGIETTVAPLQTWARSTPVQLKVTDQGGIARVTLTDKTGKDISATITPKTNDTDDTQWTVDATFIENGVYTLTAWDCCGNQSQKMVLVGFIDRVPPIIDISETEVADRTLTGILIRDPVGPSLTSSDIAIQGGDGATITKMGNGSYTITLGASGNLADVVLTATDVAGNETIQRFDDLTPPTLTIVGTQDPTYLPVSVTFVDYMDAGATMPGQVKTINGCAPERINPAVLPRHKGAINLPAITAPYILGGANETQYQLEAVDMAGNRAMLTVTIRHIPTPNSVTPGNKDEIADRIEEIQKELDALRPGIDLPRQEYEDLLGTLDDLQDRIDQVSADDGDDSGGSGDEDLPPVEPDVGPGEETAPGGTTGDSGGTTDQPDDQHTGKDPDSAESAGTLPGDKPDSSGGSGTGGDETNPETPPDSGEIPTDSKQQADWLKDMLEEAIAGLPDTLTNQQRQRILERLTELGETILETLRNEPDSQERQRILDQAIQEIAEITVQAQAMAEDGVVGRPFVLMNGMLALGAVVFATLTEAEKKSNRRRRLAIVSAVGAVAVFLLTIGWSGFALVNWWSVPILLLAAVAGGSLWYKTGSHRK